jgi:hypothetical protein
MTFFNYKKKKNSKNLKNKIIFYAIFNYKKKKKFKKFKK